MVEVWNLTKNLFGNFQNKRECVDMEETKEEEPSAFVPTATLFRTEIIFLKIDIN